MESWGHRDRLQGRTMEGLGPLHISSGCFLPFFPLLLQKTFLACVPVPQLTEHLFHFPALQTGGHSFMLHRLVRVGFGKLLQLDFLIFLSRVLEILWRHKIFLLCFPLPQVLEQEFHSAGTHLGGQASSLQGSLPVCGFLERSHWVSFTSSLRFFKHLTVTFMVPPAQGSVHADSDRLQV